MTTRARREAPAKPAPSPEFPDEDDLKLHPTQSSIRGTEGEPSISSLSTTNRIRDSPGFVCCTVSISGHALLSMVEESCYRDTALSR